MDDRADRFDDAADRRAALHDAALIVSALAPTALAGADRDWMHLAGRAYQFLRARDSLRPVSVQIVNGIPYKEGTTPVATVFNLSDADSVPFTLTGLDVKDAPVPLPDGFTATWSLADPDATGAVLTPSEDGTSAVLSAGVPDSNLMVSVSVDVTSADGSVSTLAGAEAVIVQASDATTIGIVPGTPTPEA